MNMSDQDLNLLSAIQMAMEAEQKASAFYADAAQKTANPLGRKLFEQLAEFERYHYDKLLDLEKSLRDEGTFIEYEAKELTLSAPSETASKEVGKETDKMTAIEVIKFGIDVEREAESKYTALAEQTADPAGQSMFKQLASEEHTHYLILSDAYYSVSNRGVWEW
jgi:rubrerythrin